MTTTPTVRAEAPGVVSRTALVGGVGVLVAAFPVGAMVGAVTFDVASHLATAQWTFPRPGFWLLMVAVVGMAAEGLLDLGRFVRVDRHTDAARARMLQLGLLAGALACAAASLAARLNTNFGAPVAVGPLVLNVLAMILVIAATGVGTWLRQRDDTASPT